MATVQQLITRYTGVRQRASALDSAGKRYSLVNKRQAAIQAKRRTTELLRKGKLGPEDRLILENELQKEPTLMRDGRILKKGLMGMARAVNRAMGIPSEGGHILWAIKQMDPMKLAFMYEHNVFIFDVVFDYEGNEEFVDFEADDVDAKVQDLQLIISEYDRLWA